MGDIFNVTIPVIAAIPAGSSLVVTVVLQPPNDVIACIPTYYIIGL